MVSVWNEIIKEEQNKEYFQKLQKFIDQEYQERSCFPPYEKIYKALELTTLEKVKVVLIGQDPYPTKDVAMGLAFSVNKSTKIPKSLHNIFVELQNELDIPYPSNGDLTKWANRGVLLLNRILTVEEGKPLSHKNQGWERFTLRLIEEINKQNHKIVFILLGNEAKKLTSILNNPNHLILQAPHPSPLSAYTGFFGCDVFIKTCQFLNVTKDFWRLDE